MDEAARHFERLIAVDPENADAHANLGFALAAAGARARAAARVPGSVAARSRFTRRPAARCRTSSPGDAPSRVPRSGRIHAGQLGRTRVCRTPLTRVHPVLRSRARPSMTRRARARRERTVPMGIPRQSAMSA